jgi:hypothetical protein
LLLLLLLLSRRGTLEMLRSMLGWVLRGMLGWVLRGMMRSMLRSMLGRSRSRRMLGLMLGRVLRVLLRSLGRRMRTGSRTFPSPASRGCRSRDWLLGWWSLALLGVSHGRLLHRRGRMVLRMLRMPLLRMGMLGLR